MLEICWKMTSMKQYMQYRINKTHFKINNESVQETSKRKVYIIRILHAVSQP